MATRSRLAAGRVETGTAVSLMVEGVPGLRVQALLQAREVTEEPRTTLLGHE